jgi:hypothetical protein
LLGQRNCPLCAAALFKIPGHEFIAADFFT